MASDFRKVVTTDSTNGKDKAVVLRDASLGGFKSTSNLMYDLDEDDSEIIQLEDRKRRRGLPNQLGHMDIDSREKISEIQTRELPQRADISNGDLPVTSYLSPAELAMQASHSQ